MAPLPTWKTAIARAHHFSGAALGLFALHGGVAWLLGEPRVWVYAAASAGPLAGLWLAYQREQYALCAILTGLSITAALVVVGWGDPLGAGWMAWMSTAFLGIVLTRSLREALPWALVGAVASCVLEWQAHELARPQQYVYVVAFFGLLVGTLAAFVGSKAMLTRSLVEAVERAREAEAKQTAFLAMMSHEIRTPLHGILGIAQLLKQADATAEDRKLIETLNQSGDLLLSLLDDVLDLSKANEGLLTLSAEPIDPHALLNKTVAPFQRSLSDKGIELRVAPEPSLPPGVEVDGNRLGQIIGNLVGNAAKFTEQGEIVARAWWTEGALWVSIADTGPGIAPELRPHLFERFTQGGASGLRRGTGLGLSLVRELCVQMGGGITVESTLGQGSAFTFWVRAPACAPPTKHQQEHTLSGLRLLLVDDNAVNRLVGKRLFAARGASVSLAASGTEALALLREGFAPDVVLLDINMPQPDGLAIAREIRAGRAGDPAQCVVGLSAGGEDEERAAIASGMDLFLRKPLDVDQACGRIWALLQARSPPTRLHSPHTPARHEHPLTG